MEAGETAVDGRGVKKGNRHFFIFFFAVIFFSVPRRCLPQGDKVDASGETAEYEMWGDEFAAQETRFLNQSPRTREKRR